MIIGTTFDFTTDSPHYWDRFWETVGGLGVGGSDPDSAGKTLQKYHGYLLRLERQIDFLNLRNERIADYARIDSSCAAN